MTVGMWALRSLQHVCLTFVQNVLNIQLDVEIYRVMTLSYEYIFSANRME